MGNINQFELPDGNVYDLQDTVSGYATTASLGQGAFRDVTTAVTSGSSDLVTSGAVYTAIENLPEPMVFKGTLGVNGTITTLPAAASTNEGFTYKVITAGTYASQDAKVGDVFVSNGSDWVLIPAGDTDTDTWRNIKINGTEQLGSAISTGAIDFVNGINSTVTFNSANNSIQIDVSGGGGSGDDTKVTQTEITTDANYEVLLSGTPDYETRTEGANKSNGFRYNPNNQGVMEGIMSTASGQASHAEGYQSQATGDYSHAEGFSSIAAGHRSHAEGSAAYASGDYSHAECGGSTASGEFAHAEGVQTLASTQGAHSEGYQTTASGSYSHAEGYGSSASGVYSHAEGQETVANQSCAHAEGYHTHATGVITHAEGSGTTASGPISHAEGEGTVASGPMSHAEGIRTTASGNPSHAEGNRTIAQGDNSHAEGYYTEANHKSQHVFGEYNLQDTSTATSYLRGTYVEIVGNGTNAARSNARTLDWEGREELASGLTIYGKGSNNYGLSVLDGGASIGNGLIVTSDGASISGPLSSTSSKLIRHVCNGTGGFIGQTLGYVLSTHSKNHITSNFTPGEIVFADSNGQNIGLTHAYMTTAGGVSYRHISFNMTTAGNRVSNYLYINIGKDGSASYNVGNPTAFRTAIGAAASSSQDYKENIEPITEEEAKKILDIPVYSYDYKENFGGEKGQYGMIAEELVEKIPSAVNIPPHYENFDPELGDDQPLITIDYWKLIPHMVKVIQMQQKEIDELKKKIK